MLMASLAWSSVSALKARVLRNTKTQRQGKHKDRVPDRPDIFLNNRNLRRRNFTLLKMHKFAVFLCSDRKILHLAEIVYTTSGCNGCDKYQVCALFVAKISVRRSVRIFHRST